jgi:hypothetical protein
MEEEEHGIVIPVLLQSLKFESMAQNVLIPKFHRDKIFLGIFFVGEI